MVSGQDLEAKTIRIVAAVSEEHGFEALNLYEDHINSGIFAELIPCVQKFGRQFVLLGDNVGYHVSKAM